MTTTVPAGVGVSTGTPEGGVGPGVSAGRRRPATAVAGRSGPAVPRAVRLAGAVVLGAQLVALLVWSVVQYHRFALTMDYGIYDQAFGAIAHGHLDPSDTLNGMPFWQHDGEFVLWLLAPLWWLWPHGPVLQWVQDLALVGAEAVAFGWACETAPRPAGGGVSPRWAGSLPVVLPLTALVLLAGDPWAYWTAAWDFHVEPLGVLVVLQAVRSLRRGSPLAAAGCSALAMACGSVVTTYVIAAGVGATVAGLLGQRAARRDEGGTAGAVAGTAAWWPGLVMAAAGLVWSVALSVSGADRGADLASGYGYLAAGGGVATAVGMAGVVRGLVGHPGQALGVLWSRRLDLYASLSPSGFLGALAPWTAPLVLLVLIEDGLNKYVGFAVPGFQNVPVYVAGAVGTVTVLAAVGRRRPVLSLVAAVVLAANTAAWGILWLPQTATQWLRVSPPASAVLSRALKQVPADAEVVASQGVLGRFADHRDVYALFGPGRVPVRARTVWVVVAPNQGIETLGVADAQALAGQLAGPLHGRLMAHGAGVWVFRWRPAAGTRWLTVPGRPAGVPAWAVPGQAGRSALTGPSAAWTAAATGAPGYVVAGDYWREPAGQYRVTVDLASTVPLNVEVWDDTGSVLLVRRTVATGGRWATVTAPLAATRIHPDRPYSGAGPLSVDPVPPPPGDVLEVRVWSPGGGAVRVRTVSLVRG